MNFKIVYDKPGRIRFRCGAYAFEKELEAAVQNAVLQHSFVKSAEVHAANGGILVYYKSGCRNDVIRAVRALRPSTLTPVAAETGLAEIDAEFKGNLAKLVLKRVAYKVLLPASIGNFLVAVKGLRSAPAPRWQASR